MKRDKKGKLKLKLWEIGLLALAAPSVGMPLLRRKTPEQKKKEMEEEKALMRNFKVEIVSSFWGNKVKYIQREKPLTDEELELMYKETKANQ